jgi:predicted nucleic acid-binding protein
LRQAVPTEVREVLVLDASGVSDLAEDSLRATVTIARLRRDGLWPPLVPSVVLVETLTGRSGRDAAINRFLKTCDIAESLPGALARRAAALRHLAGRGSAVDAVVAATAEPGGIVFTQDVGDLRALATHAEGVRVERAF